MTKDREILTEEGVRVPHAVLAPIAVMMRSLSAKWKLDVLFAMSEGHCRFGEIMRATPGITQHMLTTRLRELEQDGFVIRRDFGELPARVEYTLTPAAAELEPVFAALLIWGRRHARVLLHSEPGAKED